uniref:FAS1 domain-containing protein n=1 Tax=Nelumbo nucifera TaxID=4432 RepID=A0A822XR68_NELNU|nr:TPA_asm: hypothetical protein HUJ06_023985 [Nelumbo nucifera]
MAKCFRSGSAEFPVWSPTTIALLSLSILVLSTLATGILDEELEIAIEALASNGYILFGNAIATSDLRYQLLAGDSITLFAPTDQRLFSLDLTSEAIDYVKTLQYHIAPYRMTIFDLRNLSTGVSLETLLPDYVLSIANSRVTPQRFFSSDVTVDGVRISSPDIYLGPNIAAHGLDGILAVSFPAGISSPDDLGFISPATSPTECPPPVTPELAPEFASPPKDIESPQSIWSVSPEISPNIAPVSSPMDADFDTWSNSPAPGNVVISNMTCETRHKDDGTSRASLPPELQEREGHQENHDNNIDGGGTYY